MGKRSPILGYNHNVRYRGLVFHVQSEDSGILSPHLFTHLFHHGVIVMTRKLVYDAGSAEESIKSLMQAQHKAVLKDLRRGHYDDKIDSYLGGTPGLLPRGSEEIVRQTEPSEIELAAAQGVVEELPGGPTEQIQPVLDEVFDEPSAPVVIVEQTPPPGRPPTRSRSTPPPIPTRTTLTERPIPSLVRRTPQPFETATTPEPVVAANGRADTEASEVSQEIEIQIEADEEVARPRRATRDTETQLPLGDARPTLEISDTKPTLGMVNEEAKLATALSDGVPSPVKPVTAVTPVISPAPDARRTGDRGSNINAAALPPARPISRPASRPAMSQPQVVSRPLNPDDRNRRESEAVEVYSPAPPSAELPGERPGQYAQHKKISTRIPLDGLTTDRAAGVPIPAGVNRPARPGSPTSAARRAGSPPTTPPRPATPAPIVPPAPSAAPREAARSVSHTEPIRGRVATPARVGTAPAGSNRAGIAGTGVVMTRPALIVGAPTKQGGTVPRIRKAREDEGRGFGQGLISEKSLDEVILAYLSEDADEK